MKFFDLHCDTITECCTKERPLYENNGHLSVCKAKELDSWTQIFAIWMPDEFRGAEAIEYFDRIYAHFLKEMDTNSLYIKHCKTADEISDCISEGRAAAILSVEGGSALAGDIGQLDRIYGLGVKLMTLTWNGSNEIAHGCQSNTDGELSKFGKAVLKRMNELKMIVDVSHISRKGFWSVAEHACAPFVASHSTCNAILDSTRTAGEDKRRSMLRGLDDNQIRFIVRNGGLIGLNFCDSFLGDKGDDGFEAAYRHLSHILELGGENIAAMGSDYDGCSMNPELAGIDKIGALRDYLLAKGFSVRETDKIFFDNALNFFKSML